jgi:hypothetical protein
VGPQGIPGNDGAPGPQGPQGPPGTSGSAPDVTLAIFGGGTMTHFVGNGFVVETTAANTIQLRNTSGAVFLDWNITYPNPACVSPTVMEEAYRFSITQGDVLSGTLCNEGSTLFVTASTLNDTHATLLRCWRVTGNANACQKLF